MKSHQFQNSQKSITRLAHLLSRGIPIYITAAFCSAAVVAFLLLTHTPEYRSQVKILIIQKYTLTDSYTAAKSAEKITKDLAEVVHTSAFLDDVLSAGTVNLSDLLSLDEEKKRKAWSKKLEANVVPSTSILTLNVYDANADRAERLAQTAAQVLIDHGGEYHGAPDTIALRIIDSALTSKHPVRPHILLAAIAAAIAGAAASGAVVFVRSNIQLSFGAAPISRGMGAREQSVMQDVMPNMMPEVMASVMNMNNHKIPVLEQDTMRVSETRQTTKGATEQVINEERVVYSVLDGSNFQRHMNEKPDVLNGNMHTRMKVMPRVAEEGEWIGSA